MTGPGEFLLARIAEDEAAAHDAQFNNGKWSFSGDWLGGAVVREFGPDVVPWRSNSLAATDGTHIARHDPARVLADCDAKRRIVVRCQEMQSAAVPMAAYLASRTLADLALPYAGHPDYRDEWRP